MGSDLEAFKKYVGFVFQRFLATPRLGPGFES